jgi:hypothetical protein
MLPAGNRRQIWYDVNGFEDRVKLRADAGVAVKGFLHLVFLSPAIYTIPMT